MTNLNALPGVQLTLFDWHLSVNKRPYIWDVTIARLTAESMRSQIEAYLGKGVSAQEVDDAIDDIVDAIELSDDAYKICECLDNDHHWSANDSLYELMSNVWSRRSKAHKQEVELWVLANGVTAQYKVGDYIGYTVNKPMSIRREGVIKQINAVHATYKVENDNGRFDTVNFEDVEV